MPVHTYHILLNKRFSVFLLALLLQFLCLSGFVKAQDYKTSLETVVIDPGHGGKDPGAQGKKANEKDVVLAISLKLGQYIEENYKDVKVLYTRTEDVFIPLHKRAEVANKNHADLFISIHANANHNTQVFGTETFSMGMHTNQRNLEVAKKENAVITFEEDYTTRYEGFDPHSSESYIVFELMQNIYSDQSLSFAAFVQDQFRERARRFDRGVKQAGFLVLWQTTMPSVLIETGFISNPEEEAYLTSEEGQDYLASAIFRAFRDYKNAIEQKSEFTMLNQPDESQVVEENPEKETEKLQYNPNVKPNAAKIRFKVQITSSSQSIPFDSEFFSSYNNMEGFDQIEEFKVSNTYKYAVGNAYSYNEIVKINQKVKKKIPDAFIIAVKENSIIPVYQALQELGN